MSELLAPAGSMEALRAAIANGCDAVYLGMQKFGARAYSSNFDEAALVEAVAYAHIRGVKVYATVNTIVYENELSDVFSQLEFLNEAGVDGVIVQDLAVLSYVSARFVDMQAHCSTQMGIDDLEAALLCKELGAKRVVLARELGIEQVKEIRREADIPVEVFVHGALCVSYSGNCIMSGMTGNRLGNRGRCIGSCRKLYDIVDSESGRSLGRNYILSTKDLNTIEHIEELRDIDSLKIEGRMKEPVYVANVVSCYRAALDGVASPQDREKLNRTFNRSFTKGYLFHEDRKDITNIEKPNNFGYEIGTIAKARKGTYEIQLTRPLSQNDVIRIRHGNDDINLSVAKLYDRDGRLISGSDSSCFIRIKEKLSAGDIVYKTKDVAFTKELEGKLVGEYRRFPLDVAVYAFIDAPLIVEAEGLGVKGVYTSEETLSEALNRPTDADAVTKQLARLNETVFYLNKVDYEQHNAFIPAKMLNAARKSLVEQLYAECLATKQHRVRELATRKPIRFEPCHESHFGSCFELCPESRPGSCSESTKPFLCASVVNQEQYQACKDAGLETVYFHNVVPRNGNEYLDKDGELLVGGLGGIYRYRNTNPFVTDYSLNVVNSKSCYELYRLGAKRVTLSYEISNSQLRELIEGYRADNGTKPCLEMIVWGHAPLLVTKYCPLKKMGLCGKCRTGRFEIREEFGSFPLLVHDNCNCTVLNGKVLNLLDELPALEGVAAFRLNFTIESPEEVREVIAMAQGKLDGSLTQSVFNPKTDTRGHFNKEIL